MAKKPLESFLFKMKWHEAIQELPEYERLEMYAAICEYAKTGVIPADLKGPHRIVLLLISEDIDMMREDDAEMETVQE
ncbi:MAG: hypothetical protein K2L45_03185 [Muribaculaceae bacterium]|nr:hypothetical protein [Muribaculaceae bacterium]